MSGNVEHYVEGWLPDNPSLILVSKTVSPVESDEIQNENSRFLYITSSVPVIGSMRGVSAQGFPPALWDANRQGFHLAGYTEFVGIVILTFQVIIPDMGTLAGEIQVACGYCAEIGGCWACLIPRKGRANCLEEGWCSLLISRLRESHGDARANSLHGYHNLRNRIISIASGETLGLRQ
jgi:hypothetical protein